MAEQPIEPLLVELRSVIDRVDPVPASVLAAAKASFSWRTIDAELAELTADSGLVAASTRAGAAPRLLTFEGNGITVEIEVAETGSTRHLVGQLIPVGRASIAVRWGQGSREIDSDELGRFAIDGVPAGPVSLSVTRESAAASSSTPAPPVVTSWVTI